jgi:tripartite-type tricarboxylate transporter receptor subunit TctC
MRPSRRALLAGTAAVGLAGVSAALGLRGRTPRTGPCPAIAGARVRWIVPNAAGGGYDTESRLVEPFLERALGVELVVDNVPGAGGISGARALASARPDGRTLGFMGMPGLIVSSLVGDRAAPDPAALTILGRLTRSYHVWATGRDSGLGSLEDVIVAGRSRPILFGVSEVGSPNFVSIAVSTTLVGVQAALVPGFLGTRQATLAAMRGDVDLVCFNHESIRDLVASGELRPLLQVSEHAIEPALAAVPRLAGPEGWAARRARETGADPAGAAGLASALVAVVAAGRAVVGPPAMAPSIASCLGRAIGATLTSDELRRATTRRLDPAGAERASGDVARAAAMAGVLLPIVERARDAARRG